MFDWVGKRRIGYLFSGILTVVCLVFMLATFIPNAGVGLQFSIAYTGGTVWEVHFDGETPDPADVRAVLEGLGHAGSDVAITGGDEREYVLIRTEALALEKPTVVEGSAAAAAASASPGAASAAPESTSSAAPAESTAPAESRRTRRDRCRRIGGARCLARARCLLRPGRRYQRCRRWSRGRRAHRG